MKRRDFERFALIYGANLTRWPPACRPAAEALLAANPDLADVLAGARGLDDVLVSRRETVSDLRVARLKAVVLARTLPGESIGSRLRNRVLGAASMTRVLVATRDLSWVAAGLLSAFCISILVEFAQPPNYSRDNVIVAILDYDANAFVEVLHE